MVTRRRRASRKSWRSKQVQEKEAWKKSIPFGPGVRGKVTGGYDSPRLAPPPLRPVPSPPELRGIVRVLVPVTRKSPRKNPGAPPLATATKGSSGDREVFTYPTPPVPRVPGGSGFSGHERVAPRPAEEPDDMRSDSGVGCTPEGGPRQEPLCPLTVEPCWRANCSLWNLPSGSCCFRAQVDYLGHILGRLPLGVHREETPEPDEPIGAEESPSSLE